MPEDPIATYREQRFDGKRVFELFVDRIPSEDGNQFRSEFQMSVPLRTLDPVHRRERVDSLSL